MHYRYPIMTRVFLNLPKNFHHQQVFLFNNYRYKTHVNIGDPIFKLGSFNKPVNSFLQGDIVSYNKNLENRKLVVCDANHKEWLFDISVTDEDTSLYHDKITVVELD